jgi:hypothetical protein
MTKIRILLVGIIIISSIGGVLAFKAKRNTVLCTAPRNPDNSCINVPRCVGGVVGKFDNDSPNKRCMTTAPFPAACPGLACTLATAYSGE